MDNHNKKTKLIDASFRKVLVTNTSSSVKNFIEIFVNHFRDRRRLNQSIFASPKSM